MKRNAFVAFLICTLLAVSTTACSTASGPTASGASPTPKTQTSSTPEVSPSPVPAENTLAPHLLAGDAKAVTELLYGNGDQPGAYIYDFSVGSTFNTVTAWRDIYVDGKLVDSNENAPVKQKIDAAYRQGMIAADCIGSSLRISIKNTGGCRTGEDLNSDISLRGIDSSKFYWDITSGKRESANMADGEAVAIAAFAGGENIQGISEPETYVNTPELLSKFKNICIVKCKFTNETDKTQAS